MPTKEDFRRALRGRLQVEDVANDRGQTARLEAAKAKVEAMMERANHAHAVVTIGTAALEILDTCLLAEDKDSRNHDLRGALDEFESREAANGHAGAWAQVATLAADLAEFPADATRVRAISERLGRLARGLMGGEDHPGAAR